jgi:hypothetical protein
MSPRQFLQDQPYPLCILLGGTGLREANGEVHVVCALLRASSGDPRISHASAHAQMPYQCHLGSMFPYLRSGAGSLFACVVDLAMELWLRRTQLMRLLARRASSSRQGAC